MNFNFNTDVDTRRIFEISVMFLQQYFKYSETISINLANTYYKTWQHIHDDDLYHEIGAYELAVRIHYFIGLEEDEGNFLDWKLLNGHMQPPPEAVEYFRTNYFQ